MSDRIEQRNADNLTVELNAVGTLVKNGNIVKEYNLLTDTPITVEDAYDRFKAGVSSTGAFGSKLVSLDVSQPQDDCNNNIWLCRATYKSEVSNSTSSTAIPKQELDIYPETFSSEGGTSHITQAYSETRYPCTDYATQVGLYDFKGGIGWNGESFEGCDIVTPTFQFQIERTFLYDDITSSVKTTWANLTGSVNSDVFHGYSAGTVLFMGVTGTYQIEYPGTIIYVAETGGQFGPSGSSGSGYAPYLKAVPVYRCVFKFKCAPNLFNGNIAGATGITKLGWDYVWIQRTFNRASDDNFDVGAQPFGVYVNQVYPMNSFAALNLG